MSAGSGFVAVILSSAGSAWRGIARFAAIGLMAGALAACAGKDDVMVPDDPADKLYNEGLYLLQQKNDAKGAAKKFEEVDRQHPYSDWARKALLMQAFAYYEARDYDDSISAAKRYVSL